MDKRETTLNTSSAQDPQRHAERDTAPLSEQAPESPAKQSAAREQAVTFTQDQMRALQESQEAAPDELGGLLETAPVAIITVDSRGRMRLVNASAERLFGDDKWEMLGQPVEILTPDSLHEIQIRSRNP